MILGRKFWAWFLAVLALDLHYQKSYHELTKKKGAAQGISNSTQSILYNKTTVWTISNTERGQKIFGFLSV